MPFSYEETRDVAQEHLAAKASAARLADCALLESETIEEDWGFIFFGESKKYVETGDARAKLAAPMRLVVLKGNGRLYEAGSSEPIDQYLSDLEGWMGLRRMPSRIADAEIKVTFTPTAEGGRKGPAFSGYRPAFSIREDYLTTGVLDFVEVAELGPGETGTARVTFITPHVYPHTLWAGRILRVQEASRLVATATILDVLNPVLRVEEPLFEVLLGGEVVARSNLKHRDIHMCIANGSFVPTFAFDKVAHVFALFAESQDDTSTVDETKLRDYYASRDKLGLLLRSPAGATIETKAIHIVDFRAELGDDDACELAVHLASHDGLDACE